MSREKKPVCVVGSVNADLVVTVPRLPAPGETLAGGGGTTIPGARATEETNLCINTAQSVKLREREA